MTDINNRTYIMRIASGEMCDQEIIINLDANLIIIGEDNDYKTNISDEGFTSYSIPSHQEAFTFSIISYEDQIAIDLHTKNQSKIIPINLHETVLKELFPFAIKRIDTPWELPLMEETIPDSTIKTEKMRHKFKKSPYASKIIIGISIITLAFIGFMSIPYNSETTKTIVEKKRHAIEELINGNHYPVVVTEGKKDEILVLVKTQRDLDWSMQRLLKSKYRNQFKINKISYVEYEIENKLAEFIPNLLKINIDNPCNPTIKLLKEKISSKEIEFINQTFSSYFQCYSKSGFKTSNIDELIKKSELGLTESNVQWHKITENNKTIFVIKDSLNDKQTTSLITFVSSFYQQWGERQIQFSISLANNELTGKSFITKSNGYILLGNNHWLFNSNRF
ncbi:PrgH/EprH family type III secretion apparatus protein [Providencia sp.]|uniref:PrgH/EprH family type III secretion apparatus protein n=1 Tax=Providencia sp. TaxID=589 RepID=UPI002ACC650E|nr:type III secretion system protein PrgH [Providencia rettgeri]